MICAGISGHFHVEELEYVRSRGNFTLLIFLFRFSPRKRLKHLKVKTWPYTQLDHISDLVTKQVRFQRVRENHVEIGLTPGWVQSGKEPGPKWLPSKMSSLRDSTLDYRAIFGKWAGARPRFFLCLSYRTRRSGVNRAFLPSRSPYGLYTLSQQTYLTQMPVLFCECVCRRTFCLAFVWPNKTAKHCNAGSTMGLKLEFVTLSQGASRLFFLFSRYFVSNRSYRTFSKASGLSKHFWMQNIDKDQEMETSEPNCKLLRQRRTRPMPYPMYRPYIDL